MKRLFVFGVMGLLAAGTAFALRAEDFVLSQGAQIRGELLNPKESPRQTYQIKTESGAVLTLQRAQVKDVIRQRPVESEYEKIRPRYPDTVEGQWALAEWCREQTLVSQRKVHLERILELEPDHQKARYGLGYSQIGGKWTTQQQSMESQGYEFYKGKYRSKQEIQIFDEKEKQERTEKDWSQKLERWQIWLKDHRARSAQESIKEITDPTAIKPLTLAMRGATNPHVRLLFIEALAKIGTPEAQRAMAYYAIYDDVEEVRLSCLDRLKTKKDPTVVDYFVGRLSKEKDNRMINRAAVALREMGDPSAIGPLIDVLVTTHTTKIMPSNPGQYSAGFGNGPGGGGSSFGFGGNRPITLKQQVPNRPVLEALERLTERNYGFDVKAWRSWYALQKKREVVDSRGG